MSENQDEQKLKMDEVATLLEENKHTVRNWLRDFRDWIPVEKGDNGFNYFPPAAVEQMKLIKHLFRDRGFSTKQIGHMLATGNQIPPAGIAPADELSDLKQMVQQLAEAQERQTAMIEQQNELQKAILTRLEERDRQLTQFLTDRREAAAAAALPDPEARRPWWKRWGSKK